MLSKDFLGFVPLKVTKVTLIGETLFEQLVNMGLPIENMNGQEYYNRSNVQRKLCTKEVWGINRAM